MSWLLKNIGPPIPPEAQAIVNEVDAVASAVTPLLDTATALLDVAKIFYIAGVDVYQTLTSTLISETEDLIDDLFGAGVFELVIDPFSVFGPKFPKDVNGIPLLNPEQAIKLAIRSFDDVGDPNRPQFSDGANVAAFGLMATAPDVSSFLALLQSLLAVWTIDGLDFTLKRVKRFRNPPDTQSLLPDWDSISFNKVNALGDIQNELLKILSLAKGYTVVPDRGITDLIDIMQRKIDVLNASIAAFQGLLDILGALPAATGIYFFDLPLGVGGNSRIQTALRDQDLEALKINKYTFTVLYVGGTGPSAQSVDSIRKLLV